jgi:HD-like signal output (HDOD) protein
LQTTVQTETARVIDPCVLPMLAPEDEWKLSDLFLNWHRLAQGGELVLPISPLAIRLITVDPEDGAAPAQVVEIIESDPILTARILGLANAAVFAGSGRPVLDIRTAVMRLGLQTALRVALAQLAAIWMRKSTTMPDRRLLRGLWHEYLRTAFCAHEMARALHLEGGMPGMAYAGGLLHDVGTLALCSALPDPMTRFIRAGMCKGTPLYREFVEAHTCLGEELLIACGAPSELAEAARRHHDGLALDAAVSTLLVLLADHLHDAVLTHAASTALPLPDDLPVTCFDAPTRAVSDTVESLGLDLKLDNIVGTVARELERIDALAGDFL